MNRFIVFQKMRLGTMAREGEISISIAGIAALESTPGTGDQMTTITLSGGREVHVEGGLAKIKGRIAAPRRSRSLSAGFQSEFEKMFGGPAFRDFFGIGRRA